jgi:uncharacterized protein YybS (DUF2232 family)
VKNVRKLTEGAMLLAVFTVLLLLTIYIPVAGVVVNLFLAIPFILFATKNEGKSTIVFLIASILLSTIVGSLISIPLVLIYGITGAVIGYLIRKGKDRNIIFIVSTLVVLVNIIGGYAVSVAFFNINFINDMIHIMRESLNSSAEMLKNFGQEKEATKLIKQFNEVLDLVHTLVPTIFVAIALFIALLIQLVSFPIIKRFGVKVEKSKSFKDICLPKSTLWYLLITLLASMIVTPDKGTFLFTVLLNLTYLLLLLMIFQGYTFLFYYFDHIGISKSIAIVLAIVSFMIPVFLYIIGILGIIDLGFDLRKQNVKKE